MGAGTPVAAADGRARTLRAGCRPRPETIPARDGRVCEFNTVAAGTNLGRARRAARDAEIWRPDRQRDAAHVGACRVHQAAALDRGRPRVRYDRRSERPLPGARPRAEPPARLETQPSSRVGFTWRAPAGPGVAAIHASLVQRRMAARDRLSVDLSPDRIRLRGCRYSRRPERANSIHLQLARNQPLGRPRLRSRDRIWLRRKLTLSNLSRPAPYRRRCRLICALQLHWQFPIRAPAS